MAPNDILGYENSETYQQPHGYWRVLPEYLAPIIIIRGTCSVENTYRERGATYTSGIRLGYLIALVPYVVGTTLPPNDKVRLKALIEHNWIRDLGYLPGSTC